MSALTPSELRLCERIRGALTDDENHVLLSHSAYTEVDQLLRIVGTRLSGLNPRLYKLNVAQYSSDSPQAVLSQEILADGSVPLGPQAIYNASDAPPYVHIKGLELLPQDLVEEWCKWLSDFINHTKHTTPTWRFLATDSSGAVGRYFSHDNAKLTRVDVWGLSRPVDIAVLLDRARANGSFESRFHELWVAACCYGFATDDLSLARYILEQHSLPSTVDEVKSIIRQYSDSKGCFTLEAINRDYIGQFRTIDIGYGAPKLIHHKELHELWQAGLITWQPDTGVNVHPGLCIDKEFDDLFRVRLCRGQHAVLWPFTDSVRDEACRWIELNRGEEWELALQKGVYKKSEDDVFKAEFSLLIRGLTRNLGGFAAREDRLLIRVLKSWRAIRNDLAHKKVIEPSILKSAVDLALQLSRKVREFHQY